LAAGSELPPMIPVVTPDEMAAIDAASPEPATTLIARAGAAVARAAIDEMGGCLGRRVVVLAGPGANGADGRVAARRLALRGARTTVIDASEAGTDSRMLTWLSTPPTAQGCADRGRRRPPNHRSWP